MRPKTSKEVESERAQRSFDRKKTLAKHGLQLLNTTIRGLQALPKMGNAVKALQEHSAWLIAEDDAYEAAAAELYIEHTEEQAMCSVSRAATDEECLER